MPRAECPKGLTYQPFTARLVDLTERASRYGLDVVINAVPPYPADEEQEKVLQEQARQLLRDVPRIKAVVFGDEGMGSTRHGMDAWTRTCSLLQAAFAEVRPDFRTVAWRYTFRFRSPDRQTWQRSMTEMDRMDERIGYMANFDGFWMRRRDGRLAGGLRLLFEPEGAGGGFPLRGGFSHGRGTPGGTAAPAALDPDRNPLQPGVEHPAGDPLHAALGRAVPGRQRFSAAHRGTDRQLVPPGLLSHAGDGAFRLDVVHQRAADGGAVAGDRPARFWPRPGRSRAGRLARLLRGDLAFSVLLRSELDDERRPGPTVLARCEGA